MVIRGSRQLLIKQLDTSLIEENFVGARGRDAHQIGPRVMVFDANRVFAHEICKALDRGFVANAWLQRLGARSAFTLKEQGYLRQMVWRRQLQGFVRRRLTRHSLASL